MSFFSKLLGREKRADDEQQKNIDSFLSALLGLSTISREEALQIPSVSSAISMISETIAATPIRLYKTNGNNSETSYVDDDRVDLLNGSTGDTLDANEMWRAVIEDYFLGKGGYIYINKVGTKVKSLHYVDEKSVEIVEYVDPIFKHFDIYVDGVKYYPHQFIKILRKTKNGGYGKSIVQENSVQLALTYNSLVFEDALVKKGGNKKGFLKSEHQLDRDTITDLKNSWKRLYGNNEDNVVVLNKGIDFKESSNTSVEMQLNQNKITNSEEIGKIFHISPSLMNGGAGVKANEEIKKFIKLAIVPMMNIITAALNDDLLLEKEKGQYYFAFDVRELMKGDIKERFEAYKTAIDSKVLTIDEARNDENLQPLGLDFINLGLADVLYNPKTKEIFVPNTGTKGSLDKLGEKLGEGGAGDES